MINCAAALNDCWDPRTEDRSHSPNSSRVGDSLVPDLSSGSKIPGNIQLFSLSNPAIILDVVKPVNNGENRAIVVRCYESLGGAANGVLKTRFPVTSYQECNILEDLIGERKPATDGCVPLRLHAFEIKSFVLFLIEKEPGCF